jgi:hypothetical protein
MTMIPEFSTKIFRRFFGEKIYTSHFTVKKQYEFTWTVVDYKPVLKKQNNHYVIDVKVSIVDGEGLKKGFFGGYSHDDIIVEVVKNRLSNICDFFNTSIRNITIV